MYIVYNTALKIIVFAGFNQTIMAGELLRGASLIFQSFIEKQQYYSD